MLQVLERLLIAYETPFTNCLDPSICHPYSPLFSSNLPIYIYLSLSLVGIGFHRSTPLLQKVVFLLPRAVFAPPPFSHAYKVMAAQNPYFVLMCVCVCVEITSSLSPF